MEFVGAEEDVPFPIVVDFTGACVGKGSSKESEYDRVPSYESE